MKSTIFYASLIFFTSLIFFSYRLLEVPRGITMDEAAFGYNASLISETLYDENGRFLPIFVLSLDGRDWRQPVAQYFDVITFKLFGKSLFNLKFTSVIVASVSATLLFLIGIFLQNKKFGILAALIFVTTPAIVIHSHLALDNIMPVPFILLWVLGLLLFQKNKSLKFLVLSGVSLGISFYAHKSMRSAAVVWSVLTIIYLLIEFTKKFVLSYKNYSSVLAFTLSVIPFFLITPLLEHKYAGAIFGNQAIQFFSIYEFLSYYLSNFDLSFLFISGDTILHHSTGIHGVLLLATLPIFLFGVYKSLTSKHPFFIFLVICFFVGPLFFGFVGSMHRGSRLLFLIPLFSLISTYGIFELLRYKKTNIKFAFIVYCFVFVINFADFVNYYWFKYADNTYHIFYSTENLTVYNNLQRLSKERNLEPLVSESLFNLSGDAGSVDDFSRSLYFSSIKSFNDMDKLPTHVIFMTQNPNLKYTKEESGSKDYYFYIN